MATEQTTVSQCCVSGSIHEGTPTGNFETVGGRRTYISKPKDGSKAKTAVFLADIFGVDLINTQCVSMLLPIFLTDLLLRLVADTWAQNGWYVYLPDIFDGKRDATGYSTCLICVF